MNDEPLSTAEKLMEQMREKNFASEDITDPTQGELSSGESGGSLKPDKSTSYQTGFMPPDLGKLIARLFKTGFIYEYHEVGEVLFKYAVQHFQDLELFFRDFGLVAHLSLQNRLIYLKRDAESEDGESDGSFGVSLTQRKSYSEFQTIVLLYLRRRVIERRESGETRIFVEQADILEGVSPLIPDERNDTKYIKAVDGAIKKLKEAGILISLKGQDLYEISPVLQLELSVERMEQLLALYLNRLQDTSYHE